MPSDTALGISIVQGSTLVALISMAPQNISESSSGLFAHRGLEKLKAFVCSAASRLA
jgi:hypothetical protein